MHQKEPEFSSESTPKTISAMMMTTPGATQKHWPWHSAGPDIPSLPLKAPLLRLIPGVPRAYQGPLIWLNPKLTPKTSFSLSACLVPSSSSTATIQLPYHNGIPDSRFEFTLSSFPDLSHRISLILSSKYSTYTGSLLLSDLPQDSGTTHCLLYASDFTPSVRVRFTFSRISPSPIAVSVSAKMAMKAEVFVPRFSGHRGMGSTNPNAPWRVLENSLESFIMATHGDNDNHKMVTAVELDVQPTKDGRVVVCHDWFFRPRDSKGDPVYNRDAVRAPINSLTFDQFDELLKQSYGHTALEKCSDDETELRRERVRALAEKRRLKDDVLDVKARSLSDVFDRLPVDIGILVELKYPHPELQEILGLPFPTKDEFVNLVLKEVFKKFDKERQVSFLCFQPDVCDLLKVKQGVYGVYLSHCELIDQPCDMFDPRTLSLKNGLRFVKAYGLDGIMMFNKLVTLRPDVIAEIVEQGVPILTYGESNSDWKVVKHQFDCGVSGVIADDVHDLVHDLKKRGFV